MPEEDDTAELHELSRDLAGAMQSPWEPACVARAFATPRAGELALTMQGWIDLSALRSPFLLGEVPETAEEMEVAADVFGCSIADLDAEECAELAVKMLRACREADATVLAMQPPDAAPAGGADGFGLWLPIFACLVTQCGLSDERALAIRVDRAHALMAGMRRNQGWRVKGTPYALRDLDETKPGEEAPRG